jgi:hypothetical protein
MGEDAGERGKGETGAELPALFTKLAARFLYQRRDGHNIHYFGGESRMRGESMRKINKVFLPATGPRGRKGRRVVSVA